MLRFNTNKVFGMNTLLRHPDRGRADRIDLTQRAGAGSLGGFLPSMFSVAAAREDGVTASFTTWLWR